MTDSSAEERSLEVLQALQAYLQRLDARMNNREHIEDRRQGRTTRWLRQIEIRCVREDPLSMIVVGSRSESDGRWESKTWCKSARAATGSSSAATLTQLDTAFGYVAGCGTAPSLLGRNAPTSRPPNLLTPTSPEHQGISRILRQSQFSERRQGPQTISGALQRMAVHFACATTLFIGSLTSR